ADLRSEITEVQLARSIDVPVVEDLDRDRRAEAFQQPAADRRKRRWIVSESRRAKVIGSARDNGRLPGRTICKDLHLRRCDSSGHHGGGEDDQPSPCNAHDKSPMSEFDLAASNVSSLGVRRRVASSDSFRKNLYV